MGLLALISAPPRSSRRFLMSMERSTTARSVLRRRLAERSTKDGVGSAGRAIVADARHPLES